MNIAVKSAFALLLSAVVGLSCAAENKIKVLWLGQSAFRITTVSGKVIVVDPWLKENPRTPEPYKQLEHLGKVDLILVTHGHADHLADAPGLAALNKAKVYGPGDMNQTLVNLGVLPSELAGRMNKGGELKPLPGVRVIVTRAEHSSTVQWKNPQTGKSETHPGGEPLGFIIELENGFRIYHMGDTALFGDLQLIAQRYRPDLVLIPIGGNFTMGPEDAAFAIREWLRPKFVWPMHYGTNPLINGSPEEFQRALGQTAVKVLAVPPGSELEF